jgi:rhodanese-related sulfurtransferase
MKLIGQILLLLCAFTARAGEVNLNGVKPAAIIDVRTPEEFVTGHIEGALNIPYEQIGQGILSVKGINKESPILVYCRSGRRSAIAKAALERLGYRQIINGGGMENLAQQLRSCNSRAC